MKLKKHLFICTYKRETGEDCASKGSNELVDQLKKWVKSEKIPETKVTRSGCLGLCEEGIASVCYPKGEWRTNISLSDVESIKKSLT